MMVSLPRAKRVKHPTARTMLMTSIVLNESMAAPRDFCVCGDSLRVCYVDVKARGGELSLRLREKKGVLATEVKPRSPKGAPKAQGLTERQHPAKF